MNAILERNPEIEQERTQVLTQSSALTVTDAQTYELAQQFRKALKGTRARIWDWINPRVQGAHKQWKDLVAMRDEAVKPFDDEDARLDRECLTWRRAEVARAQAEQQRLQRLEQERQQAMRLEQAAALERQGQTTQAAVVLEQAVATPAPMVPLQVHVPKVEGVAVVQDWEVFCDDETQVPREYMAVDLTRVRKVVKAHKGKITIPGIRIVPVERSRTRAS